MEFQLGDIVYRQRLFESTLKSSFMRKITKYKNILLKNGIHLAEDSVDGTDTTSLKHSQSFDDHVELVLSQQSESPNARKTLWKIGSRVSTLKLFQWIFLVVQRTKAARVLKHLDGVSVDDIERTLLAVAMEIAVSYEYQIMMLDGDLEVIKLSQHASACMITYLNSNEAAFLPENLLQAILEIKPCNGRNKDILKTRSVVYNNVPVCLKWRLSQILKQTGLRIFVKTTESPQQFCGTSQPVVETIPVMNKSIEEDTINATDHEEKVNSSTGYLKCNKNDNGAKENNLKVIKNDKEVNDIQEKTSVGNMQVSLPKTSQNITDSNKHVSDRNKQSDRPGDSINKPSRIHRKLNVIDMDFENGIMAVTEQSVIASEFSAVDNNMSDKVDGDDTYVDEDFNSEGEMISEIKETADELVYEINDECAAISSKVIELNTKDLAMVKPVCEIIEEKFEMLKAETEIESKDNKCTNDLIDHSNLVSSNYNVNNDFCVRRQESEHNISACRTESGHKFEYHGDNQSSGKCERICTIECQNEGCNGVTNKTSTIDTDEMKYQVDIHDEIHGAIVNDTNILHFTETLNISTDSTPEQADFNNVHIITDSTKSISNENQLVSDNPYEISNTAASDQSKPNKSISLNQNNKCIKDSNNDKSESVKSLPFDNIPNERSIDSTSYKSTSVNTSVNDKSDSGESLSWDWNISNHHLKDSARDKSESLNSSVNDISDLDVSLPSDKCCSNSLSNMSANNTSDSSKRFKNGLKMQTSKTEPEISQSVQPNEGIHKFYGCFTPYGAKCRPEMYGYRGPLHVWNEKEGDYTFIYNDMVTVLNSHDREIVRNNTDYHQSYIPQTNCSHNISDLT